MQPNSVARSLADFVCEQISGMDLSHKRVSIVRLRLGEMCDVQPADVKDAFSVVIIGTPLQNCRLEIEPVEPVIFCPHCQKEQGLCDIHDLKCPECGQHATRVVHGREFEISSIETMELAPQHL